MKLPSSVREIAEVIGHERALYLVGKLPRTLAPSQAEQKRAGKGVCERVYVYVPTLTRIKPDHMLVQILGWNDATKLCKAFGGEILKLATCGDLYREFRAASIVRLRAQGVPTTVIAEWMQVTPRLVRAITQEMSQVEVTNAANDNVPHSKRGAGRGWTNNKNRAG